MCLSITITVSALHQSFHEFRNPNLQHMIVQTDDVRLTEDQIEILQRLRRPKTLHLIDQRHRLTGGLLDIEQTRKCNLRPCSARDGQKHGPRLFQQRRIARHSIEDEAVFKAYLSTINILSAALAAATTERNCPQKYLTVLWLTPALHLLDFEVQETLW